MTSFEESAGDYPGEPGAQSAIEVPVPHQPDEAWCSMLTEAYGGCRFRTTIKTKKYLKQINPNVRGLKQFHQYRCSPIDGSTGKIDGLFVGAKMVPEFDDGPYVPHAVLVDTEQLMAPFAIADQSGQEFMVPLGDDNEQLSFYIDLLDTLE